MFEKDNTVYKTFGNGKLLAVKLWSMVGEDKERVTKFKFEFREFDKTQAAGKRDKGGIDVYMDIDRFTYFCKLLESGRIWALLSNSGNKPAYETFGGTSMSKGIQISNGNKGMLITGQQGPGSKTQTGAMIPDYKSWNPQNSKKIILALSDEVAVQLGSAGLRAIQYLDWWTAFGKAEQNLDRINPHKEDSDRQNSNYQSAQPRQQSGYDQQNGYGRQQNYGQQQGYAAAPSGYGQQQSYGYGNDSYGAGAW